MKILTSFCIIFVWSIRSYCQFGVGVQASSVSWLDNQGYTEDGKSTGFYSPGQANGFALEGHYIIKPKMRVRLNLEYEFTNNEKTIYDTTIGGHKYEKFVNVNDPVLILRAEFDYAFTHNFVSKGFTFYGLGGLGVNTYFYSSDYGSSADGVNGYIPPAQSKLYTGLSASIGLGIEYEFNQRIGLFLDARGCTGATTHFTMANLQNSNPNLLPNNFNPAYISSVIGVRFNLGNLKSVSNETKTK